MIRGTTPCLILNISQEIEFDALYITFVQGNETVLEKTLDDVKLSGTKILIKLTQAETLSFDSNKAIKIQLRGKVGENAYASRIVRTTVSDILKEGEI